MFKTIGSCSTAYGTYAAAVRGFLRQYPDPAGSRNVQASKHDSQRRFTSVAIRCDTSEETRISANHAKHLNGCLAGLEELPLGDGPCKCPGQWRFRTDNSGDKMMQTGKVVKTR